MKILVSAATAGECEELRRIKSGKHQIEFAITGTGMIPTTYFLTRILARQAFDLVINAGIAGSFNRSIAIGEVVYVSTDILSELGAEDDERFLTLGDIGLAGEDTFLPSPSENFPALNNFRKVTGITVNTVHGNEKSIAKIIDRLHPDIETMEGAAAYFVCMKEKIPAIQLRAISNYVEKRNRGNWNIELAVRSLAEALKNFIETI
jgi:futalosine hydrolase